MEMGWEWSWEENKRFENVIAEAAHAHSHSFPSVMEEMACRIPGKTKEQMERHLRALVEDVGRIERGLIPLPDYITRRRKKAVPWTKEEHEQFLIGLERYGKGDWRSISRQCVVTKTPIQIASHAQKYFLRLQRVATRTLEPKDMDQAPHLHLHNPFAF